MKINFRILGTSTLPFLLLSQTAFAQDVAPSPAAEQPGAAPEAAAKPEEKPSLTSEPTSEEAVVSDEETASDEGAAASAEAEKAPKAAPEEATLEDAPVVASVDAEKKTEEAAKAASEASSGPSLLPLKVTTYDMVRGEVREGYDRLNVSRARFQEGDQVVFRTRLGLETNPVDLVDGMSALANFTPQASGQWGTSGAGGTIGEANVGVYEGFFKVQSERFDVKLGRFAMNYGDAMVIGNLDWHQSGRAFDGAHTHYKMDKGYVDFFATQQAEGQPAVNDPFLAGDSYFWGAYAGLGGYVAEGLDLDLYFLGLSAASTTGLTDPTSGVLYDRDGATLFTAGARIKQSLGALDYRVEGGLQFGETPGAVPAAPGTANAVSTLAYNVDGEVGASFSGMRVSLGGVLASGNDTTTPDNEGWNELFPTGHKFLGLMDVIGNRTNVGSGNLKFKAGLTESLTLNVDGHIFARLESGGLGQSATSTDDFAGGEVDAQLLQKIGKWVHVRGLYGIFIANEGYYGSGDPAHYGELEAAFKF